VVILQDVLPSEFDSCAIPSELLCGVIPSELLFRVIPSEARDLDAIEPPGSSGLRPSE
jgi:hypothetical protein